MAGKKQPSQGTGPTKPPRRSKRLAAGAATSPRRSKRLATSASRDRAHVLELDCGTSAPPAPESRKSNDADVGPVDTRAGSTSSVYLPQSQLSGDHTPATAGPEARGLVLYPNKMFLKDADLTPAPAVDPNLVSLPDDVLIHILLCASPPAGVIGWRQGADARALAAAHPRLDRLFRRDVVAKLEAGKYRSPVSVQPVDPDGVQRMLRRYPRVRALSLALPNFAEIPSYTSVKLRALQVHSGEAVRAEGVAVQLTKLLSRCSDLVELSLVGTGHPLVGDEEVAAIAASAPPTLSTLSNLRVLSLACCAPDLTDIGGVQLGRLHELRELDLTGCRSLRGLTFDALATLPVLSKLSLSGTYFSNVDAARSLPQMMALLELDVSRCPVTRFGLWNALPPALTVLRTKNTRFFEGAGGNRGGCGTLRELDAANQYGGFLNWAQLAFDLTCELRVLALSNCTSLGDGGVDDALRAMPHLESLDLRGTRVGNETAFAVSRHLALRDVRLEYTEVGSAGLRALRCWKRARKPGRREFSSSMLY